MGPASGEEVRYVFLSLLNAHDIKTHVVKDKVINLRGVLRKALGHVLS
jgi:hypothetical protein